MADAVHVSHMQMIQALEKTGFRVVKHTNKHFILSEGTRYLTVPKVNQVHSLVLNGILRDLDMTIEQFRALL